MNNRGSAHHRDNANNRRARTRQQHERAMAAMAIETYRTWRNSMRTDPVPMHNSVLTGQMRVHEILNGHPRVIEGLLSMELATFRDLSNHVIGRGLLSPTNSMTVDEQLFIFIYICAQGATIQQAAYLFQHSKETTSRWFGVVLFAICAMKDEFIRPPDYTAVQPLIQEYGNKYQPWFDGCIGAIDGTHIPCVVPSGNAEAWINRKGYHSQNILAACSFDMKFTYILTGYEGSCHDARILADAIALYSFPIPPPGKFYLADSGYANKDCFLSPYRRATYHIPEYRRRRDGLGNRREVFNYTHSSLRNCIERTFGVWKARFKILKGTNNYPMDKQAMIPVACAVLHNYIRTVQVGDNLHAAYAGDCMPVVDNVDVNAEYEEDDETSGTGPSTVPQHHDTRPDAMNTLRDMMADDMWERFRSDPWYRTT